MCALHVEGDQLAQRVAAVAIRPEAIAAGLQPVGEELRERGVVLEHDELGHVRGLDGRSGGRHRLGERGGRGRGRDRKSTRLNSSHLVISYAVFCLKKKKKSDLTS